MKRNNEQLNRLQQTLAYQFSDSKLLVQALTHRSKGSANNERLEFLGDAILGFISADLLYAQFSQAPEGHLSRFRASLVKKETLAELAREFSLGEYLRLGSGELKSGGFRRDSILADGMEAIFGAMYLDGGMDPVRALIERCLSARLEKLSAESDLKDPKTRLQEYLQARRLDLPEYTVTETHGEAHEQEFRVECRVAGLEKAVMGIGGSRRKAEQTAAQQALGLLLNAT
ncbi:MAG: ribonuclease III [Ectothiorhodospiraceae bacterium]|nr:ribonuclease III [Ectothiorhodospiraceae bacterium]